MQHEQKTKEIMTYEENGERFPIGLRLPFEKKDWDDKRLAVDTVMNDIGGVVTRVGDETIGEMWSLWDGKDILNEIDPRFAENIERHIHLVIKNDPLVLAPVSQVIAKLLRSLGAASRGGAPPPTGPERNVRRALAALLRPTRAQ